MFSFSLAEKYLPESRVSPLFDIVHENQSSRVVKTNDTQLERFQTMPPLQGIIGFIYFPNFNWTVLLFFQMVFQSIPLFIVIFFIWAIHMFSHFDTNRNLTPMYSIVYIYSLQKRALNVLKVAGCNKNTIFCIISRNVLQ